MQIIRRLTLSLLAIITVAALSFTYLQSEKERSRLMNEMEKRARLLAESLVESVRPLLGQNRRPDLQKLADKFRDPQGLLGIGFFDADGKGLAATKNLGDLVENPPVSVATTLQTFAPQTAIIHTPNINHHYYSIPIYREGETIGVLLLVHDVSHIAPQIERVWKESLFKYFTLALFIVLAIAFIAHWSLVWPIRKAANWVKNLRLNAEEVDWKDAPDKNLFGPLAREVRFLAQSLAEARAAAEEEAKLRLASESHWTPERLKEHVKNTLGDRPLFVIANREPYVHSRVGKEIRAIVPASGLVTAIEPILKACGGFWVGHGAGNADKETVDKNDHVRVPPEDPLYTLRRVWMTKEEEQGYYYGFSNEGLWPLCHIAHTRPVFRPEDWEQYRKINQRFADAAVQEMEGSEDPCVLIQDYHFALLPQMIKQKRPDARVALFWHIPWPNPESFGICPWQREILGGMLGADLLGFHIQYHCNNFLETVDRALESRIDWANFSVTRDSERTIVKPFPISVALSHPSVTEPIESIAQTKEYIARRYNVDSQYLALGVDRIDYTKGILERFRAVERFLDKNPGYIEKFTFVELGAPSRTFIETYHSLDVDISQEAERINNKLKTKHWKPIVLLKEHHSHKEIEKFYRVADLCLVTSLHDGMNLVAKEYVVTRMDKKGVLILSRFAGAAQELRDSLIVNPYDIDQTANAIYYALTMDVAEKKKRMGRMQESLRENNIYRWGADLITELAQLRIDQSPDIRPPAKV